MGRPFVDLTNQRYGNLIVISYAGKDGSKSHYRLWNCRCDCGKEKIIPGRRLVSGNTISCGCVGRSNLIGGGHNKLESGIARFNDLFISYQKSAKRRNREFTLTREQFYILTQQHCYYCGMEPSQRISAGKECNGDYVYNGLDRIDNTLGYIFENTRPCCKTCNVAKSTMTEQEFYAWLERVASRIEEHSPRLVAAYTAAREARFDGKR